MKQVFVIVEGQTEEAFIKCAAMRQIFAPLEIYFKPQLLGVKGHQGGRTNYARVQKDILLQLKQDRQSYCTTMIDFYGLGTGFPGTPPSSPRSPLNAVRNISKRHGR